MPTASNASASDVTPQILTNSSDSSTGRGRHVRAPSSPSTAEVRSADRTSVSPTRTAEYPAEASRSTSAASRIPDSATATTPSGIRSPIRRARSRSTSKLRRSRWLTPTSRAPTASARSSSASSWTSTSGARARRLGQSDQIGQFGVTQRGHDQQDGVGPHEAGVAHVEGAHREVLAQHGQRAGRPGGFEIGPAPPEELLVGEDGQARRATGFVVTGHRGRIEGGVEVAPGRRPALDLGDDGHPPCRPAGLQCGHEVPGGRRPRTGALAGQPVGCRLDRLAMPRRSAAAAARWATRMESR